LIALILKYDSGFRMNLTPSQLSSLNEMEIPVWALRSEKEESENAAVSKSSSLSDCVVLLEMQSDAQQAQRLIKAILFSISLNSDQFTIINSDQVSELQNMSNPAKLLLVFGEKFAQSLWGKSVIRGQSHQTLDAPTTTVVSFSLGELLKSPELKALVWQDLLLAQKILNAS